MLIPKFCVYVFFNSISIQVVRCVYQVHYDYILYNYIKLYYNWPQTVKVFQQRYINTIKIIIISVCNSLQI